MPNFPTSLDDGSSLQNARTTGQAIPGSDHNDLANAIIAIEKKIGTGAALATGASAGQVLQADGSGGATWQTPAGGGGGTGTNFVKAVTQTAHGLAVGNAVYFDGTNFVKSKALLAYPGDPQSKVIGVVSAVADANNFTLVMDGVITGLSGLSSGKVHFLSESSAGGLTSNPPVDASSVVRPVLYALSTTSGEIRVGKGRVNVVARPWARMGINYGYESQTDLVAAAADLRYLSRYTDRIRMTIPSWDNASGITHTRALVLLAISMGFKVSYGITAAGTGHNAAYVDSWYAQIDTEAAWAFANGVDRFYIGNEEDWFATIGGITGYTDAQIQTKVLAKANTLKGTYPSGMEIVYSTAEGEFLAWDALANGGDANWQFIDVFGINMYNADFEGTLAYALSLGFGSKLFLSEWADQFTYVQGGHTAADYRAIILSRRQSIQNHGVEAFFFTYDWGGSYGTVDDWGLSNGDTTFKPGFEQLFSIPR